MRNLAAVALLAVLAVSLSGCSGGEDGGSPAAVSTTTTSTAPPAPPVPTTDTLHFLESPTMTPVPPTGSEVRSPVTTANFGGGPGGEDDDLQGASWAYQVTAPAFVTGAEVHVWVDVKEQMLDTRVEPVQPRCTWSMLLQIGADSTPIRSCYNEPTGPINPGVKELVFTIVLDGSIELEANETVSATLQRTAFSLSPNNAVDALSGSADRDSRVVLRGLKEPVRAGA